MSEKMIEVTGLNVVKFVSSVYELSQPVGMGFLHFEPGDIPDEVLHKVVEQMDSNINKVIKEKIIKVDDPEVAKPIDSFKQCVLNLDYVLGRQCKMNIWIDQDKKLWIRDFWYDHHFHAFEDLLDAVNMSDKKSEIDKTYVPRG